MSTASTRPGHPEAGSLEDTGARVDRFAYLHGFSSGPGTRKGRALTGVFSAYGKTLLLPDLNRPSFAELTYAGMLEAVDDLDAGVDGSGRWCFVGSSMGGWVAARWAELHPERVRRLVLLAPGFDLPNRWRQLGSPEELESWERRGWIEAEDGAGNPTRLHWGLMEDARRQPPIPEPRCPVLVLHGARDEVVPVAVSRSFARDRAHVELEVLDDDHSLLDSVPRIAERSLAWFGVSRDPHPSGPDTAVPRAAPTA